MDPIMAQIVEELLWSFNGWILIAIAIITVIGWFLESVTAISGRGLLARFIGIGTTFLGITLVLTVIYLTFKSILTCVIGWGE